MLIQQFLLHTQTARVKNRVGSDKRYQLDGTIMIYYHKFSLHVSGIYMPIFRSTGCMLLHMVFSTVKENQALVVGLVVRCVV